MQSLKGVCQTPGFPPKQKAKSDNDPMVCAVLDMSSMFQTRKTKSKVSDEAPRKQKNTPKSTGLHLKDPDLFRLFCPNFAVPMMLIMMMTLQ